MASKKVSPLQHLVALTGECGLIQAPSNAKDSIVTIINSSKQRTRIMAGAMLMTAAASGAGLFGATASANAADGGYVAVAIGLVNDAPPVTTVGGLSVNADQSQALQGALSDC